MVVLLMRYRANPYLKDTEGNGHILYTEVFSGYGTLFCHKNIT